MTPLRRRAAAALTAAVCLVAAVPAPAAEPRPPAVQAPQAFLLEASTGDVLFRRQAERPRPVASATKLMTALVVLERVSLQDTFTASGYRPQPIESKLGLEPGERMKVRDLLRALLLASANDAAHTLAQGTAGTVEAFVALMNDRARSLGLAQTRFTNPIGLDHPGNHSSAADLVRLTLRLRRRPFFARTVDLGRVRLGSGVRPREVVNRNDLVRAEPVVDGVKTGHTELAGYVLVGSATRDGVSVISAVLGDPSEAARDADTLALLRYGLSRFRSVRVVRPERVLRTAPVQYRPEERVGLVPARAVTRVLRVGERPSVSTDVPDQLEGPLPAGAPVGTLLVRLRGRVSARVALVTAARVPEVGLFERTGDQLRKPATLAALALVASLVLLLLLRRRRRRRRRPAGGRSMETETA